MMANEQFCMTVLDLSDKEHYTRLERFLKVAAADMHMRHDKDCGPFGSLFPAEKLLASCRLSDCCEALVMEANGVIVGYAATAIAGQRGATETKIDMLYVLHDYRRNEEHLGFNLFIEAIKRLMTTTTNSQNAIICVLQNSKMKGLVERLPQELRDKLDIRDDTKNLDFADYA